MVMRNQDGIRILPFSDGDPSSISVQADTDPDDYEQLAYWHVHDGDDSDARYETVLFVAYRNIHTNQETCKLCLDRGIR